MTFLFSQISAHCKVAGEVTFFKALENMVVYLELVYEVALF